MTPFVLTPSARQDLNDIYDSIANDNPEAAGSVLCKSFESCTPRVTCKPS
jgi:plasmid stabilization system protein ParE